MPVIKRWTGIEIGINPSAFLVIIDRIYFAAVIMAALATATSIVASLIQYQLNQAINQKKDEDFALYRSKVGVEVSDANKIAAVARNSAAQAELAAQTAKVKTAQLEKEAAAARLDTERMRQQLAWRTLTETQIETIYDYCAGALKDVDIELSYQSDPETNSFASQIFHVLKTAGCNIQVGKAYMDQEFYGAKLRTPANSDSVTEDLKRAMGVMGLTPLLEAGPNYEIVIGLKAPPRL